MNRFTQQQDVVPQDRFNEQRAAIMGIEANCRQMALQRAGQTVERGVKI